MEIVSFILDVIREIFGNAISCLCAGLIIGWFACRMLNPTMIKIRNDRKEKRQEEKNQKEFLKFRTLHTLHYDDSLEVYRDESGIFYCPDCHDRERISVLTVRDNGKYIVCPNCTFSNIDGDIHSTTYQGKF